MNQLPQFVEKEGRNWILRK